MSHVAGTNLKVGLWPQNLYLIYLQDIQLFSGIIIVLCLSEGTNQTPVDKV